METEKVLEMLGLNEKEAKVYLALLQMGQGTVPAISTRAGTKRPTTYLILDELRKKDLVMLLPRKIKAIYTAKSPEVLLEEQREKEELIVQKMPELLAIYNSKKEKPKVIFYQGKKQILELYHKEIFKSESLDIFCSIKSIHPEVLSGIWWFLEVIEKKKIPTREILQSDQESIKYAEDYASEVHQVRIMPKELKIPTDNIIFQNKLAIFSYKDEPMVVVIESSDVAETYRSMFEMVWNSIGNNKIEAIPVNETKIA